MVPDAGDAVDFCRMFCGSSALPRKEDAQKTEVSIMYDVMSPHAVDFIDDGEIQATLKFAEENKDNAALISEIIAKGGYF